MDIVEGFSHTSLNEILNDRLQNEIPSQNSSRDAVIQPSMKNQNHEIRRGIFHALSVRHLRQFHIFKIKQCRYPRIKSIICQYIYPKLVSKPKSCIAYDLNKENGKFVLHTVYGGVAFALTFCPC